MPSAATVSKWQVLLDPGSRWLQVETDHGQAVRISCILCTKWREKITVRNHSDAFIRGVTGTALKKDNIVKHQMSDQHKMAVKFEDGPLSVNEIYKKTAIGRSVASAQKKQCDNIAKLIEIAYTMAKKGIPFKLFPSLVSLEQKHGVSLSNAYHNEKGCREFTQCIAETLDEELRGTLKHSKYFSILTDGSTDSAVIEQELIYIISLQGNGKLTQSFLKLKSVTDGTAPGLKGLIMETLHESGLDADQYMVGFGADGASVNMGVKRGVAALLKEEMPWVISVHCFNHRLELAVRDAFKKTYYEDITTILTQLHYLYHNSPKRLREVREPGRVLDSQVLKPRKSHGTRWVQHKLEATKALLKSYPVIVTHLESMSADKTHDQAKASGLLKKITTLKFVLHLLFFQILLEPLSRLSLAWQRDAIEIPQMMAAEKTLQIEFQNLKSLSISKDGQLSTLLNSSMEGDATPRFMNIELKDSSQGLKFFKDHYIHYVTNLEQCCNDRFCLDDSKQIFNCVSLLDTNLWPHQQTSLNCYGDDNLKKVAVHFSQIIDFGEAGTTDTLLQEWHELKQFIKYNMSGQPPNEVWAKVHASYSDRYPVANQVVSILRVLPFSNALVERCFSAMGKIKSDWRASLSTPTLDMLIRIKKMGPDLHEFSSGKATEYFLGKKPRRLEVEAYGPRKKCTQQDEDDGKELPSSSKKTKIKF